jgi:hypothetical protein
MNGAVLVGAPASPGTRDSRFVAAHFLEDVHIVFIRITYVEIEFQARVDSFHLELEIEPAARWPPIAEVDAGRYSRVHLIGWHDRPGPATCALRGY